MGLEIAALTAIAVGMAWDVLRLRIPHGVCLVIIVLMPIWGFTIDGGIIWFTHIMGAVVAFGVGYMMWRLRWIGGGDVKFLAAIALWVGIVDLGFFLVVMSVLGALLGVVLLLLRKAFSACAGKERAVAPETPPLLRMNGPVPYGVAIGLAAFLLRGVIFSAL
ncbi:MAG: prepilin peptidase [Dongiaceae bacterium]